MWCARVHNKIKFDRWKPTHDHSKGQTRCRVERFVPLLWRKWGERAVISPYKNMENTYSCWCFAPSQHTQNQEGEKIVICKMCWSMSWLMACGWFAQSKCHVKIISMCMFMLLQSIPLLLLAERKVPISC